ncbi:MAG: NERD domain-containing protein [Kiritimatiellae bacterium]|nr:NERD domain-containing protein [Kiritimatiellia bacterium]
MARILTEETSLARKRDALMHETDVLSRLLRYEWIGAGALLLAGAILWWVRDSAAIFGLGVAGLIFAVAHTFRIRENRGEEQSVRAGLRGEADVTRALSQTLDNTHYIFNDLLIRNGRTSAQIDHLVVGPRGLFLVETKNWRGHIEGGAGDEQWTQTRAPGVPPIRLHNPIIQARRQANFLRESLRRAGVRSPEIHPLVVFRSPRTTFRISDADLPLLRPDEAARHIRDFTATEPCDEAQVDAVVQHLMRIA